MCWWVRRSPNLRSTWLKVLSDAPALCSSLILALFLLVTLLDSVHFRRALPAAGSAAGGNAVAYDTRTESLLDLILIDLVKSRESSYSMPLAVRGFTKESRVVDGQSVRVFPRLEFGGAHLKDADAEHLPDVLGAGRTRRGRRVGADADDASGPRPVDGPAPEGQPAAPHSA